MYPPHSCTPLGCKINDFCTSQLYPPTALLPSTLHGTLPAGPGRNPAHRTWHQALTLRTSTRPVTRNPGTRIFLFNFEARKLMGVFVATGHPKPLGSCYSGSDPSLCRAARDEPRASGMEGPVPCTAACHVQVTGAEAWSLRRLRA